MLTMPVLSIIIVNYDSTDVLRNCLNSIVESRFPFSFEVLVIDNASEESITGLIQEFSFAIFVTNKKNCGFAFANNVGISRSRGKYVLLLNPDTVVNAGSLNPMMRYLDEHTEVGIVGCKIFNAHGEVEHSTHSFPTLSKEFIHANEFVKGLLGYESTPVKLFKRITKLKSLESYWDHDSLREVDHVTGACMMVRKEAIDKVGLLDEAFFLYNEEVEWSYRMKRAGYKSVFLPDSNIIHLFGYSTKQQVQKQVANRLLLERYRGMFYFFQKHYGFMKLLVLRLIVAEGFALRLAVSYIERLNPLRGRPFPMDETIYMRKILMLVFTSNFDWRRKQ